MSSETTGSTGLYDFLGWLDVNKKRLLAVAIAAVLIGFIVAYLRWRNQEAEVAANEQLLQLRPPSRADAPEPAAQAFLKVATDYPNTDAAPRAVLLAAGAAFTANRFPEALAQFDDFLRKHEGHPLAPTAAYGKAAALEAQDKYDDALAAYQSLITRYPSSSLINEAKLARARIYEEKNQPQLALQQYEEITGASTAMGGNNEALSRKEYLLKLHPELAKTNAPSATTTNAVSISSTNKPPMATGATNR